MEDALLAQLQNAHLKDDDDKRTDNDSDVSENEQSDQEIQVNKYMTIHTLYNLNNNIYTYCIFITFSVLSCLLYYTVLYFYLN